MQREMDVRIGETGLAFYEAYNPTDRVVAGTASYNVTPDQRGRLFHQDRLFLLYRCRCCSPVNGCMMPVTFYVDPEIVNDPEGKVRQRDHAVLHFPRNRSAREEQAALAPAMRAENCRANVTKKHEGTTNHGPRQEPRLSHSCRRPSGRSWARLGHLSCCSVRCFGCTDPALGWG